MSSNFKNSNLGQWATEFYGIEETIRNVLIAGAVSIAGILVARYLYKRWRFKTKVRREVEKIREEEALIRKLARE